MKRRPFTSARFIPSLLALCMLTSCEDKAKVKKNEGLREQVLELQQKVSMMEVEVGQDPGDQSEKLALANEELKKSLAELKALDEEKTEIEAEQAAREKQFREYQKKYRIKE